MTTSNILNVVGLCFDIAGVTLLFFYEPPKVGHSILLESAPSQEKRDLAFKLKRLFSRIALVFLLIGFTLQIVDNTLPIE